MEKRRLIALDTETTGISPKFGDRLISIGCVEISDNGEPGATYHQLINPERPVSIGAQRVHGYSWEMLKTSLVFLRLPQIFCSLSEEQH